MDKVQGGVNTQGANLNKASSVHSKRYFLLLLHIVCFFTLAIHHSCLSQQPPGALANYTRAPDSSFKWQLSTVTKTPGGVFLEVDLISQTWQKLPWSHRLMVYLPKEAPCANTVLLVLRHIYNRHADLASLKIISDSAGTASAILSDIPNQPSFNGREEDDLQAYTFSRYISTGDESWPLLFPMVKSVVRAMDAVTALASKESGIAVNSFIIAGHSKRGHAAWLTAAVDSRVKGIIPVAINVLNGKAQMPHHLEVFGEYSTPSLEATGLLPELELPRGKALMQMIDPFSYKEQLAIPKLVVSAANDNFFPVDALNFSWDSLVGPKWILQLSNANHARADADPRVNSTAFAFARAVASGKQLPLFTWKFTQNKESLFLKMHTGNAAINARIWVSESDNRDFRRSKWIATPAQGSPIRSPGVTGNGPSTKQFETEIKKPVKGALAIFGEIEFMQEGHSFLLSTQTQVLLPE
ncbi:MAG: PhoPQ-activated protein PqaA family protein [Ferruginibacter sp.]